MNLDFQILVVGQNDPCVSDFVQILEGLNADVLSVPTAKDAISQFTSKRQPIVFTDIDLPDISTVEFTKTLCAENPRVLVAMLAADSQEQQVIEGFKAGASDFLRKPVKVTDVKFILSRFIGLLLRRQNRVFSTGCLHSGEFKMELESSAKAVTPTVALFSQLLAGYFDDRNLMRVELALQEALMNALEHGNLGLTSKEKTELAERDELEREIETRSKKAREEGKKVRVHIILDKQKFKCQIEDEGEGFNWEERLKSSEVMQRSLGPQGRGMFLVSRFFDEVSFNDTGSCITLLKKFS